MKTWKGETLKGADRRLTRAQLEEMDRVPTLEEQDRARSGAGRASLSMTTLPMHLKEIEDRANLIALAIQGLQAAYGQDEAVRDDFDAVLEAVVKLRAHIHGVCVESAGDEVRTA